MTREDVIREIVDRDIHGLTLSAEGVQQDAEALFLLACEYFGTWDTALKYAGVSSRRVVVAEAYHPDRVLKTIQRLCRLGCDLSSKRNLRRDRRLHEAARQHFGSWQLALRAAGINTKNVLRKGRLRLFRRQEILDELRRRHEVGEPLTWTEVCRENQILAVATKRVFLSWQRAMAAAGLVAERNDARRGARWDRGRVIEAIIARHREGKRMTATATRKDDPALGAAVRRYFQSWTEAMQAAGVEAESRGPKGAGK